MGKLPFLGKDYESTLIKNRNCKLDFDDKKLNTFPRLKKLLKSMLDPNPNKRPSAKKIIQNEFFTGFDFEEVKN